LLDFGSGSNVQQPQVSDLLGDFVNIGSGGSNDMGLYNQ
jgi:hypothetical protein